MSLNIIVQRKIKCSRKYFVVFRDEDNIIVEKFKQFIKLNVK